MKKFIFIGATALAMIAALCLCTAASAGSTTSTSQPTAAQANTEYTKCKFNCTDFTGLELSGVVDVTLSKSNAYKVEVTLPSELQEYLLVWVKNGVLKIGWNKEIPSRIQKKLGNWTCKAVVSMPELRKLDMSGATRLRCDDTFDLGNFDLSLDLSGASNLESLNVNANELEAEISGACGYKIAGGFREADIELSGASNGKLSINADKLDLEISGACKARLAGESRKTSVDASGACELDIEGIIGKLEVDASGASKIHAMEANVEEAVLETSGACRCDVNVSRSIMIEDATGASSINYKAPKDLGVMIKSIGRSASVKRVN